MPSFSAALMAGGKSTRMGRDKALLPVDGGSQLLWQRQLDLLRSLQPRTLLWSGPQRPGIPGDVMLVSDAVVAKGPLAGVSACLHALRDELLVVLAVDLAHMEATYLRHLLRSCTSKCGAVARRDGYYEPLAAVYPKSLTSLAAEHLQGGRASMQGFVQAAVELGAMKILEVHDEEAGYFANFNTPDDLKTF